jgi:hypothetical protein
LRKITIKINETDYVDFLLESCEHGLTPEEQIYQIINYYILVRRRRAKIKFRHRDSKFIYLI